MPAVVHNQQFQVRLYECDAYGHVNNAVYLRYMEEAALGASAAVGYPWTRYAALGRTWFTRDTTVEYFYPITFGDSIDVHTWLTDLRRVRSLRVYEMYLSGTDQLVARGETDWTYIDTQSKRPVMVPDEVVSAYHPGETPPRLERDPFPSVPPAPDGFPYQVIRRVEWRDLDSLRHVNNAIYLTYMEDAAMQAVASFGWPVYRMRELDQGPVATETRIQYLGTADLDDELVVSTYLSNVRRASGTRHYTVTRTSDGQLLAQAYTRWAWVDLVTGRPCPIPREVRQDLAGHIIKEGE